MKQKIIGIILFVVIIIGVIFLIQTYQQSQNKIKFYDVPIKENIIIASAKNPFFIEVKDKHIDDGIFVSIKNKAVNKGFLVSIDKKGNLISNKY